MQYGADIGAKQGRCRWQRRLTVAAAVCASLLSGSGARAQQTDALAREAIIGAMTGNDEPMRRTYAAAQPVAAGQAGISTADAIYYLYNCTRASREEFLAGQEILAANTKSKDWRNRILLSLLSDEIYELNKLEGQNRFNKYTRVFNRVSSSLSQLVMLQPQAAASLLWDGMYSLKKAESTTVKERKMIFLCDQYLKKYPDGAERADVLALQTELKHKMMAERAEQLGQAGRVAMGEGKFGLAVWHLEKAVLLNPTDQDTAKLLNEARVLGNRLDEIRSLTLGVSDVEARLAQPQAEAVGTVARAVLKGDIQSLESLRGSVPFVADSVDYAYAAITEKQGRHDEALNRLNLLTTRAPQTAGGRGARKLLDNPNYNLNESYLAALKEMSSERTKFIWTGRRTKDDNVYAAGSAAIQNVSNPIAVPALFGLDAAVRAVSERFRTQINVDGVIDSGARYLRKYPNSPRSQEIRTQLADLSKKAGNFESSLEYLEQAGTGTQQEVAKLHENQARALLEKVQMSGDLLERRELLQELTTKYAETNIVRKNGAKELAKLPPALAADTVVLPAQALKRDSRLAQYLGVAPALVDGSGRNGEVSDEGLAITASADAVEFRLKGEDQWRRGALLTDGRDWVLTAARQLRQDFFASEEGRQLLARQRVPLSLDGGLGSGGIDAAVQVIPYPTTRQDRERFE